MRSVTIVDETGRIDRPTLCEVAIALQLQVDRDLAPEWETKASIRVGTREALGRSWRLSILDRARVPVGLEGVHLVDGGQPFALVAMSERWTVTASHEMLEMLVNPYGRRFISAPSLEPGAQGRQVQYLNEVCGPCQTLSYFIGRIEVSDFVLANFYHAAATGPFDRMGRLAGPLDVPSGGFLSWLDPADNHWRRISADGTVTVLSARESRVNAG